MKARRRTSPTSLITSDVVRSRRSEARQAEVDRSNLLSLVQRMNRSISGFINRQDEVAAAWIKADRQAYIAAEVEAAAKNAEVDHTFAQVWGDVIAQIRLANKNRVSAAYLSMKAAEVKEYYLTAAQDVVNLSKAPTIDAQTAEAVRKAVAETLEAVTAEEAALKDPSFASCSDLELRRSRRLKAQEAAEEAAKGKPEAEEPTDQFLEPYSPAWVEAIGGLKDHKPNARKVPKAFEPKE